MKLLYWFSIRGLLVLEVGDCGVFENEPVFLVWSQCESFRSDLEKEHTGYTFNQ